MPPFESIIRPFETPQALAGARTAAVVAAGDPPGPAVLEWGQAGAVPPGAPIGDVDPFDDVPFTTKCCADDYQQKTREKETVRIDATDGSGFFVEFERPTLLSFFRENNACNSTTNNETIVIAPLANIFTPEGQPIYAVTDNRAKNNCDTTYRYRYDDGGAGGSVNNGSVKVESVIAGQDYYIDYVGTTDFTLIGAASNEAGAIFTATGAGGAENAFGAGPAPVSWRLCYAHCSGHLTPGVRRTKAGEPGTNKPGRHRSRHQRRSAGDGLRASNGSTA